MGILVLKFYKYAHRHKTDGALFSPYGLASTKEEQFLNADLINYLLAPGDFDLEKETRILKLNKQCEIPTSELRRAFEEIDHRIEERNVADKAQLKKLEFLGHSLMESGETEAVYRDIATGNKKYSLSEEILRCFLTGRAKPKGDFIIPEIELIRGLECLRHQKAIGSSISHGFD